MSEGEGFLARWSRLKREQALVPFRSGDAEAPPEHAPSEHAPLRVDEPPPAVDLASLPPIESMGAGSDISAYLGVGVPLELTKTALRNAWRADPAVRDFVEIADNQWDFNTPDAIPGFGALGAVEEAKSLIARAMTGTENIAATVTSLKPAAGGGQPDSQVTTAASLEDSRVVDPVWQVGTVPRVDAALPVDAAIPQDAVAPLNATLRLDTAPPRDTVAPLDATLRLDAAPPPDTARLEDVAQTSVVTIEAEKDVDPSLSAPGRRGHGSALPK
jgi:hypothetical protein